MKAIARYEGTDDWVPYKDYEVDISLDIGRNRDEEPMPIITLHENYWVKCYHSLEEFFKDWRIMDVGM